PRRREGPRMAVAVDSLIVAPPTSSPRPASAPKLRSRPPAAAAVETPHLSVVIVTSCQWRNTARVTRQLRRCEAVRRGAAEVVIVDNHSPADRSARKLRRLSGVSVFRNGENRGFAKAVNRGSKLSRGEW